MGMHRDFRMIVRTHELGAFHTDCAITKRRAFGGARYDPDVLRHELSPVGTMPAFSREPSPDGIRLTE